MNITDVRVRKVAKEGKMKAVVSVTIDDEFVVHDIAHPINSATREQIQTIILDKYQEVMAEEAENEVLMEAAE